MKKAYDPNLPIENLFEQINDEMGYAAAGNTPYKPLQIVTTAYQLIFNTGVFGTQYKNGGKKSLMTKYGHTSSSYLPNNMDWRQEQE